MNLPSAIPETLYTHKRSSTLFEEILDFLPQIGADFGMILLQTNDGIIYFRANMPGRDDWVGPARHRFAQKLLQNQLEQQVITTQTPVIVADAQNDPRWYRAEYLLDRCRGAILFPLVLPKIETQGLLLLGSLTPNHFKPADVTALIPLVHQIGFATESTILYRNQQTRSNQLSLINQVGRAAAAILNLDVMLTTVTRIIQQSFRFIDVVIYRLEPHQNQIIRHPSPAETSAPDNTPPDWVVQTLSKGETLIFNDLVETHPNPNQVKARLAMPLKMGAKIVGALELDSAEIDVFTPPIVSAIETLSDQLAVAIENARLYDALNQKVDELLALNRITQSVSVSLNVEETLTLITQHVTAMLNVAATSVALLDGETGEIWFAAASGGGANEVLGKRIKQTEGIVGWVLTHGEAVIVPNVKADRRFYQAIDQESGFKTVSILAVPLSSQGQVIGVIEAMNKLDGSFTTQDLERLTDLTTHAAISLEKAQLYQELAEYTVQVESLRAFNENVIETISTGLIALDIEGYITVFNKAGSAMLGLRVSEVMARPAAEALSTNPDLATQLLQSLATREASIHRDVPLRHWDGSEMVALVIVRPLYNTDDRLSGVVGLIEDQTEQKMLEAERRRLDRLVALGEMSAVVAHELRNPLAGIAAGVNYFSKRMPDGSTDAEAAQMIVAEVDRIHHIIEDILLIARPLELARSQTSLPDLLHNLCRRQAPHFHAQNITIQLDVPPDLPQPLLDVARIEQVFTNLCENARHAMPAGGQLQVSARHAISTKAVVVTVADTGTGISPTQLNKVFEPFFTTKTRGTGLGLALARQIITAHAGELNIAQSNAQGTIFEIWLPLNPPPGYTMSQSYGKSKNFSG